MFSQRVSVEGDRIVDQKIVYGVFSKQVLSKEEISKMEKMKESEFLEYVKKSENIKEYLKIEK